MAAMSGRPTKRILVGLDGSAGSAAALDKAIELARALDAEVVAAHVFELPYPSLAPVAGGAPMGVAGDVQSVEDSMRRTVKQEFDTTWCAPLRDAGVRHRELFGDGRAGPMLQQTVDEEDVDLIVVGRRGRSALVELLAGSVSQYLVHRAGRPVLVTADPAPRKDRPTR